MWNERLEKATSDEQAPNSTIRALKNKVKDAKSQLTLLTATVVKLAISEDKTVQDEENETYLENIQTEVEDFLEKAKDLINEKECCGT